MLVADLLFPEVDLKGECRIDSNRTDPKDSAAGGLNGELSTCESTSKCVLNRIPETALEITPAAQSKALEMLHRESPESQVVA